MAPSATEENKQDAAAATEQKPQDTNGEQKKPAQQNGGGGGDVKINDRITVLGHDSADWNIEKYGNERWPPCSNLDYLPTWSYDWQGPIEPFEYEDCAKRADPTYPNLFANGGKMRKITDVIGAEVTGVNLRTLTPAGKDELAHLLAHRHVVAFRGQDDFIAQPIGDALDWGRHFGKLHIHPVSAHPPDHPEIHIIHRPAGDFRNKLFFRKNMSSVQWHHDLPYENQPAGYTFMYGVDHPECGHDTIFANMEEMYDRMSPAFQERLHGLRGTYTSADSIEPSRRRGGPVRRDVNNTTHPVVRTHPLTGRKSIYVSKMFIHDIEGMTKDESQLLINYIDDMTFRAQDLQCRMNHEKGTVVAWDNRNTAHAGCSDSFDGSRRLVARITPCAEVPYETPYVKQVREKISLGNPGMTALKN